MTNPPNFHLILFIGFWAIPYLEFPLYCVFRSIKLENDKFFERARSLRKEMSDWSLSVTKEADEILERFPLEIKEHVSPDFSF